MPWHITGQEPGLTWPELRALWDFIDERNQQTKARADW